MGLCAHPGVSYCSIDVVKELLHRLVEQSGRVDCQFPQDKDLKEGKRREEKREEERHTIQLSHAPSRDSSFGHHQHTPQTNKTSNIIYLAHSEPRTLRDPAHSQLHASCARVSPD